MFNNLGAIGNYTAPGAFRGQTFNTYTGGSLMMRSPNKVYQLAAIQFPSAKAGCGGIDVFGGSFSHISATEFKNMLRTSRPRCRASPSSWRWSRSRRCWAG
jgi:conjugative transfer pilus assembly protein TraH